MLGFAFLEAEPSEMTPGSAPSIPTILRQTQLFANLDAPELENLAKRAAVRQYRAGESLFVEGEACSGFYVVVTGRVRIFKTSPNGREYVLAIETAGNSLAELPVFDGGPYPASAAALEDSQLIFISRDDFRTFCLVHPAVALQVIQVVGTRLRRLVAIIEELSFSSLRHRLITWLLRAAKADGRPSGNGLLFPLKVTHQELATQIGTVRELVSRNMSRLQAEGLIEIQGREIRIVNLEKFEAELR
jgi:CRP/FNR family transcriptional regulator